MGGPRFVVLEDHPLVRDALASQLVSHFGDSHIVYSGADVEAAVASIHEHGADCVIVDLDLGDRRSPLQNVEALTETDVPLLIVSALGDPATIKSCLLAGAIGFVSKQAETGELVVAVKHALMREPYTSTEVAAALMTSGSSSVHLSEQERKAMTLYASGLKMRTVARQMGVTEGTAQEYIKRVRAKYVKAGSPIPTKTDMYRRAQAEGLLP